MARIGFQPLTNSPMLSYLALLPWGSSLSILHWTFHLVQFLWHWKINLKQHKVQLHKAIWSSATFTEPSILVPFAFHSLCLCQAGIVTQEIPTRFHRSCDGNKSFIAPLLDYESSIHQCPLKPHILHILSRLFCLVQYFYFHTSSPSLICLW